MPLVKSKQAPKPSPQAAAAYAAQRRPRAPKGILSAAAKTGKK